MYRSALLCIYIMLHEKQRAKLSELRQEEFFDSGPSGQQLLGLTLVGWLCFRLHISWARFQIVG